MKLPWEVKQNFKQNYLWILSNLHLSYLSSPSSAQLKIKHIRNVPHMYPPESLCRIHYQDMVTCAPTSLKQLALSHLVILCFFCLLGVYSENKHLIPIWGIQTFKNFTWTCTVLHLNSTVLESGSLELPASTNSCLPNETTVSGNSGIFVIVVCLYWKTMARRKKLQKR